MKLERTVLVVTNLSVKWRRFLQFEGGSRRLSVEPQMFACPVPVSTVGLLFVLTAGSC